VKRFLSILLLNLYLLFSGGLVVSLHYCGGSLANAGIFTEPSCCCDDETTGKPDDCCKDEVKTVKITDDQLRNEEAIGKFQPDFAEALLPSLPFCAWAVDVPVALRLAPSSLPRPPDQQPDKPAYLLQHAFLFYS